MKIKLFLSIALGFGLAASSVMAHESNDPGPMPPPPPRGGPEGRGFGGPPPPPPMLLVVFDTDKDGTLSVDEIKKASESLAKLDKDGDGKLSREELCPPPPPPPRPTGEKKKDAAE